MLILTRKLDESILIGDDIRITVTKIKGKQVAIGIEAPRDLTILRDELEDYGDYTDEFIEDTIDYAAKKTKPLIKFKGFNR